MSTQRKNSVKDILTKLFVTSIAVGFLWAANYAEAQTQVMDGVDDGTVHINLGHTFPYYGGVFTDAWMSSNGFILFYDPANSFGNPTTYNNGCCNGFFPGGIGGTFSYMLAPLWTDLRHDTSIPDSGYFYETGKDGTAFLWQNITEFGTNNLNTFGVQLWPDGSFDFHYADVNITNHNVWIGFTGDTTSLNGNVYDEVNELFYKTAQEGGMTTDHIGNFASETYEVEGNTYYAWYGEDGGYTSGPDCSNPLNDSSCEGYEEAYFNQQCEQNPLYDTQCPGYEQAYYEQQCSADPLYDSGCPGYAEAYHDLQCSLDSLYKDTCPGYKEALFEYNCTLDPQYDMLCPGYIDEEMFIKVDDTKDDFSGVDDGSDDGTSFNMDGIEETVYTSEDSYTQTIQDEKFVKFDDKDVHSEEVFINNEQTELVDTEELVANDGKVNEEKILEDQIEDQIEEELVILEEMEVVEVLEEKVLEEEVELDKVELVPVTEKVVATAKVDATSLVLAQTAKLVSNLREESASSSQNSQNTSNLSVSESAIGSNSQEFTDDPATSESNSQEFTQQTENLISETENSGQYMSPEQFLFGSDNASFAMMTGSVSNNTESVSENEQTESDAQNVEQNLALGDLAPIGFAIIPVQTSSGMVETVIPIEEQSLAERLAERIRQKNLENSNEAAIGQTAVLQQIASGTDMSAYYDKTPTYKQDMYTQEQVYGNIVLTDNVKSHYKMFSENHGTMQELIRSQY